MSKITLAPLHSGDRIRFQDKTMTSSQEAEVIVVYKRTVRIRTSGGEEKVIHRKYIFKKI